jgi:methylthioribose-1-phosphate isomerase
VKIDGRHYRTIWVAEDGMSVEIIDQTKLPFSFETARLTTLADAARAIRTMQIGRASCRERV